MRLFKCLTIGLCTAALTGGLALSASGQGATYSRRTIFTFSGPVEVPGYSGPMVLQAGTYVFRLMDDQANRRIVQIWDKDQTHLYATVLAIPDYQLKPSNEPVVHFAERSAGSPEAVKAWFYPGDQFGWAFVYPKVEASELAVANNEPVPAVTEESATTLETAPVQTEQPTASAEPEATPAAPAESATTETPVAPVQEAQAEPPAPALPQTASDTPLIGLCGLLLLVLGGGLKAVGATRRS